MGIILGSSRVPSTPHHRSHHCTIVIALCLLFCSPTAFSLRGGPPPFLLGSHLLESLNVLLLGFPALQYVFPFTHLPHCCQKDPSKKKIISMMIAYIYLDSDYVPGTSPSASPVLTHLIPSKISTVLSPFTDEKTEA